MKILAFVDLHENKTALKKIINRAKQKDIDIIVCAGDISIFGEGLDYSLERLNKIGKPILMIHGNHEDDIDLRKRCKKLKNCYFIHNNKYRFGNHLFIGWGGGGFSFRDRSIEKNSKRLRKWIQKDDKIVFVTHAPPYNTKADKIYKEHAGNKSIRRFIESIKPVLSVSGHLHETAGKKDKIGNCIVVNPGAEGMVFEI